MRGRIRTVKPEIFMDEELWDLAQETGFPILQAFEGLWCFADKEGRFEWRPRALKPVILPYWDGDFSRVLDALTTRGFVVRYAVEGREYGLVRTFKRHQVINNRESDSELPPPPGDSPTPPIILPTPTREARVEHASSTPLVHAQVEGKGKEGKGKEGSGTIACARDGWSRLSEWDQQTFAASVPTRFRKLYLERFGVDVAVGGQHVGGFPQRLLNTAEAQGRAALGMLDDLFAAWVDQGRPGVDKQIPPYSAFVARFDALAAPALAKTEASPQQRLDALRKQNIALMEAGNFGEEYQRVNDQIQALQRELEPPRGGEPRRAFGR